ncbi:hypothetical protein HYALB_00009199 [Hymenoscyphus albidus]|uniref:N-acetyltransferase domain-containing protein n=1 Tax=Hymenoscyphus albidus TaxID=595503 RepID=A0A9N9Q7C3_9HELO|nr:hypothetical protein HYALB_00009199 [Hymenoscyphus albidus]
MSQQYTLYPLLPHDTPALYPIYSAAFSPTPFYTLVFPPSIPASTMYSWYTRRISLQLQKPQVRGFKIVTAENEIVAFARWNFPYVPDTREKEGEVEGEGDEAQKEEKKEKEETEDDWPPGTNLTLTTAKFGGLDGMREEWVDPTRDYVCALLAVHPTHQRKSLGKRLLQHVLNLADAEGRRVYIEATDAGYPLYKKLGFEQVDVLPIDMRKWGVEGLGSNIIMIREPVLKS